MDSLRPLLMIMIAEFSKGGFSAKPNSSSPSNTAAPSKFDTNASKALKKN
mgnify:CR=1 FL=1